MHCAFALLRVLVVVANIVQCLVLISTVWVAFCVDFGGFRVGGIVTKAGYTNYDTVQAWRLECELSCLSSFGPMVGGGDCLLILVYITYSRGEKFLRYENGFTSGGLECFWSYWLIWI